MEKNNSGVAGKKIKTLIIVKGNLKKVNFVTFHIIFKHKLFVIDKILPHDHKTFSPKKHMQIPQLPTSLLASVLASGLEHVVLQHCDLSRAEELFELLSRNSGSLKHLDLSENRNMFSSNHFNKDRWFQRWLRNDLNGFPSFEDFPARFVDIAPPMMIFIANLESINLSTCSLAKYKLWLILGYIAR